MELDSIHLVPIHIENDQVVVGMAKHIENSGLELATSACISVAVLTDSDHHQGRICDHARAG